MAELSSPVAVIFDMDGLMLDTERLILWGWQRAMADFGYPAPEDLYLRSVGVTEEMTDQILLEVLGDPGVVQAVRERERSYVRDYVAEHGVPIKPGLRELLDYLDAQGLPRAVASSAWRRTVEANLGGVGLLQRFQAMAAGDEVTNGKPAPDVFLLAARRLGVVPEGCLVLEDSEAGIQAARAAGMAAIMVPDLKPPSPETIALADAILPSLGDVQRCLVEHLSAQG
jgi:HAD superfamily hydrolase (TIGR01509 family)